MKVLGIETATIVCGAAVACDGDVVAEEQLNLRNGHAENLMSLVDSAMRNARVTLSDLDGVAVSAGPGSFTGLRIGLSVAKGFAFAADKQLASVPTLAALAQRVVAARAAGEGTLLLPVLDARRDEVYCQLFRILENTVMPLWDARAVPIGMLLEELRDKKVTVTGDGKQKFSNAIKGKNQSNFGFASDSLSACSAASVALMGTSLLKSGGSVDPVTAEPLYVKDFYTRVV